MANCSLFVPMLGIRLGWRYFFRSWAACVWLAFVGEYVMFHTISYPAPWIVVPVIAGYCFVAAVVSMIFDIPYGRRRECVIPLLLFGIWATSMFLFLLVAQAAAGMVRLLTQMSGEQTSKATGALMRVPTVLILPMLRKYGARFLRFMGMRIHPNLSLLSLCWCVMSVSMCTPLALGGSDSAVLAS